MNNFLDTAGLARLWQHILAKVGTKVDKVEGKGLSTNDFTDEYKTKLDELINNGGFLTAADKTEIVNLVLEALSSTEE